MHIPFPPFCMWAVLACVAAAAACAGNQAAILHQQYYEIRKVTDRSNFEKSAANLYDRGLFVAEKGELELGLADLRAAHALDATDKAGYYVNRELGVMLYELAEQRRLMDIGASGAGGARTSAAAEIEGLLREAASHLSLSVKHAGEGNERAVEFQQKVENALAVMRD